MTKVQIIGPKSLLDECIRTLHAMAVLHIETVPPERIELTFLRRLPLEKEKLEERGVLEKALDRIISALALLPPPEHAVAARVERAALLEALEEIGGLEEKIKRLHARKDALKEELSALDRYERLLRGFAPIVPKLGGLKNIEVVGLTIEKTREDVVGLIDSEMRAITGGDYEIYAAALDESTEGVVLAYPRRFDRRVRHLLSGRAISEVRLPEEYEEMTLLDALKRMGVRKGELPGLIETVEGELKGVSTDWYGRLLGLKKAVEDALDEIGVLSYAAQTSFAFVIEGWAPVRLFAPLREKFLGLFGDGVLLRELEIKEKEVELVPVHIRNPRILKPFEIFLSALPPPKYGSVDPTPYIAVFFPAFFGLIVGDVGYGAVILLGALYLRKRFRGREPYSDMASVLVVSSLSAIVFGLLFGEFFGDLGTRLGIMRPLLFHRAEALKTLIYITLGIGIGQVVLGFSIGAVNRFYRGKRKEAGAKLAYLALVLVFLFIIAVLFGYLPGEFLAPGVVALLACLVLLIAMEGFIGPLEFIKALGNILSYVRIMAVGTASVVMALVANRIGEVSEHVVVGIIAAAIIHLLNIILSVISPAIQSMRLQYVEFFSKFYEGGGRLYRPFSKR